MAGPTWVAAARCCGGWPTAAWTLPQPTGGACRSAPRIRSPRRVSSTQAIPLGGCTEDEGCFDRVGETNLSGSNGVDIEVNNGSSFIMATELTPRGPRTRTILTYSES